MPKGKISQSTHLFFYEDMLFRFSKDEKQNSHEILMHYSLMQKIEENCQSRITLHINKNKLKRTTYF